MKKKITDFLGNQIQINFPPKRIISLVPSQTELLFDLGLAEKVIGITDFCVRPADKVASIEKIGGTKNIDIEKIRKLEPDLIIGAKEENSKILIKKAKAEFPVWLSDVRDFKSALKMIREVGKITGTQEEADYIADKINSRFSELEFEHEKAETLYLIWKSPYMCAGSNSYISSMIEKCSLLNKAPDGKTNYPKIELNHIKEISPQFLLLPDEPYNFSQKEADELSKELPETKVIRVDGQAFSWYGSRMLHVPKYFKELFKNEK